MIEADTSLHSDVFGHVYIYSCCQWYQLLIYYVGMRVRVGVYINIWVRARARLCIYAHTYSQRSFLRLETYGFITNLAVCVCVKNGHYTTSDERMYSSASMYARGDDETESYLHAVTLKATVPHSSRSGIQIYISTYKCAHTNTHAHARARG